MLLPSRRRTCPPDMGIELRSSALHAKVLSNTLHPTPIPTGREIYIWALFSRRPRMGQYTKIALIIIFNNNLLISHAIIINYYLLIIVGRGGPLVDSPSPLVGRSLGSNPAIAATLGKSFTRSFQRHFG